MESLEPALFRPPLRRLGLRLLVGAVAGLLVGAFVEIPVALAFLFGAVAAGLAVAIQHARGLRVVADERGLKVLCGAGPVAVSWAELRLGFGFAQRMDGGVQRYAIFADGRGRSFAFSEELDGVRCQPVQGADGSPVEVIPLREAALLLGLIVQRAPAWYVFPEAMQPQPVCAAVAEASAGAPSDSGAPSPAREVPRRARRVGVGGWGILLKLGPKIMASFTKIAGGALKAAKSANLAWAVASVAAYSVLFSWKFAIALMLQLFVHEYGHVHAMRSTGMKVRGMYFVPFLGAMAVTDDSFTSRRQQVWVALSGPVWGSALILLPLGLYAWSHQPIWAAVATWWALINLFNLLPISPLDGGRVLQSFAFSFSSGVGIAFTGLGLAGAVALATAVKFSLIWFVAALGALELVSEVQARQGARALRLLPQPAQFTAAHWLSLRAALGGAGGAPREGLFLRNLERQQKAARAAPLSARQLALWGLAYAGLAVALLLLVYFLRHVPGADAASKVLE